MTMMVLFVVLVLINQVFVSHVNQVFVSHVKFLMLQKLQFYVGFAPDIIMLFVVV